MKIMADIRQLYKPVQPVVTQSNLSVSYRELLPHINLQSFIYCYWQLKTTQKLSAPFEYCVVADGCIDIFFELDNPQESFVMGFSKTFNKFDLGNSFNYVGIRFLPTMFPQLFKINASEVSDTLEELKMVLPGIAGFIERSFSPGQSAEHIRTVLDHYFLQLLTKTTLYQDPRLYGAIDIILKNAGRLHIEKDLNTGVSTRQLQRIFDFYIGDTAKTFSKVVRFQNLLKATSSTQKALLSRNFFDAGYYDQAHFIKEFKSLYGTTPGTAFDK